MLIAYFQKNSVIKKAIDQSVGVKYKERSKIRKDAFSFEINLLSLLVGEVLRENFATGPWSQRKRPRPFS